MINEILKHYNRKFSAYNLVFRRMRFIYYIFLVSGLMVILNLFPALFMDVIELKISLAVFAGVFITFFFLLNKKAKRIIEQVYCVPQREFMWGGEELYKRNITKMRNFLETCGIDSKEKVEELLKLLNKEAENRKFSGFVIPGAFIAFSVPVWNNFVGWIYKYTDNINMAITNLLSMIFVVFITLFTYSMMKFLLSDLFDRQSKKIKELERFVESIYFMYIHEGEK